MAAMERHSLWSVGARPPRRELATTEKFREFFTRTCPSGAARRLQAPCYPPVLGRANPQFAARGESGDSCAGRFMVQ